MRIPRRAPSLEKIFSMLDSSQFSQIFSYNDRSDSYYHWDELRHRPLPEGFTLELWWAALKAQREGSWFPLPFADSEGVAFGYSMPSWLLERLCYIDMHAGGTIETSTPDALRNPDEARRYLISSLVDEAITSSQLEGAITTRVNAREMIRTERKPRDVSEQMIFNNYQAMLRIRDWPKSEPLSPAKLFELHQILMEGTLPEGREGEVGRFRREGEIAQVFDTRDGELLHTGVPSEKLEECIEQMCAFANGADKDGGFIHPVVRAILLHFWLAWLHPFTDGNGRTARALFYWSVLRSGYRLLEYVSISEILRTSWAQYGKAFLYTETDENDVTYFLRFHLRVIRQALEAFERHIEKRQQRMGDVERALRGHGELNYRQLALLTHALRHVDGQYTFASHAGSHGVSIPTARTDLNELETLGLLTKKRRSRTFIYRPVAGLDAKIRSL